MDSDAYLVLRSVASDPYAWIGAASLFLGLAVGQAARAVLRDRRSRGRSERRKARRIARAIAFLSLALLFATGLLVFPPKAALDPAALRLETMGPYALSLGVVGALVGLLPRALGLPAVAVAACGILAARGAVEGWTPYREALTVARLLPYEASGSSFRGELEVAGPGSASGLRPVTMAAGSASICVDALELSGPLGLVAHVLYPTPRGAGYEPASRFYRVAALVAPGAAPVFLDPPAHLPWIDALLPLTEGAGLEPGGAYARSEALAELAVRVRSSAAPRALVALEPVYYDLDEDKAPRISARQRPMEGWALQ